MHRLIYLSRSLVTDSALAAIISTAIKRNRLVGLTGMLWTGDGYFAQVLEGDAEHVSATMDRISADYRHTDVEVLLDRPVCSRQFGTWSMRQADDGEATAFMLGFALSQSTPAAARLRQIVLGSVL